MDIQKQLDLDSRIYNFSIQTIGFVKSLQKQSIDNAYTNLLIKSAGDLATCFIDYQEDKQKDTSILIQECRQKATESFGLLKKIECGDDLINLKTNLLLEASDFMKIFNSF